MKAIRLTARIDQNRRLEIQLPAHIPEGDAEVIVLIHPDVPTETRRRHHLKNLFAQIALTGHPGRSAAEIDRQLAEERNSWGQ